MAKEILLDSDIDAGQKLIKELDASGVTLKTALWFFYPDIREWKLLLSSPDFEKQEESNILSKSYSNIFNIIREGELNVSLDTIKIVLSNEPLKKMFNALAHASGNNRIRMSANYINGIYIEDALIYRNIP